MLRFKELPVCFRCVHLVAFQMLRLLSSPLRTGRRLELENPLGSVADSYDGAAIV